MYEPKIGDRVQVRGDWHSIQCFSEESGTRLSNGQWVCASAFKWLMTEPNGRRWWIYDPENTSALSGSAPVPDVQIDERGPDLGLCARIIELEGQVSALRAAAGDEQSAKHRAIADRDRAMQRQEDLEELAKWWQSKYLSSVEMSNREATEREKENHVALVEMARALAAAQDKLDKCDRGHCDAAYAENDRGADARRVVLQAAHALGLDLSADKVGESWSPENMYRVVDAVGKQSAVLAAANEKLAQIEEALNERVVLASHCVVTLTQIRDIIDGE